MPTTRSEEVTLAVIPSLQPGRTQRMALKYTKGSGLLDLTCESILDGNGYHVQVVVTLSKDDTQELIKRLLEAQGEM